MFVSSSLPQFHWLTLSVAEDPQVQKATLASIVETILMQGELSSHSLLQVDSMYLPVTLSGARR